MPLIETGVWLDQMLRNALSPEAGKPLAIAVSGGGDSLALLHLAADCAGDLGITLSAVTVDHGLRPDAAEEARQVGRICKGLGVEHTILNWQGWEGSGNLQDQARRARYRLMADWAEAQGIGTIGLAHTMDDQAETFLMRLAREAGTDGLAGMQTRREAQGVIWLRPLLQAQRQQLRDYLSDNGVNWNDDPSNEDDRYERVKARQALPVLANLGIDASVLSAVASNLRMARTALEWQTRDAADSLAREEAGDVILNKAGLMVLPDEILRRLLVHTVKWVSSADYGPRRAALTEALAALRDGKDFTLHGCRLLSSGDEVLVVREWQAVKDLEASPDKVWDNRWRLSGPENKGISIKALGEAGLRLCPLWRDTGRLRATLPATPAVWRDGDLIAAPMAGFVNGWKARLIHPPNHFKTSILSH